MSERLDGSSSSTDRQAAIDRFNTPCEDDPHFDHSPFVFLLSTRAGGVGINLTAASVVVIYDSDWNPQNDTQAQARCHRIGQTKTVKVYRLITRDSYEQHMFDTASRKLGLEQALMSGVTKNSTLHLSKEELNNLIKNGAYAAFSKNEEGDQEKSDQFVSATIDDILSSDRARTVTYGTVVSGGRKSAFSKATFVANEEDLEPESPRMSQPSPSTDEEHGNNVSIDDTDFWRKLVGDDSLAQLVDDDLDEDMGERRSKFSGSYAIPSLSEMIRQTQGAAGQGGQTPAQTARQLERQRLGFWFSKSKRRDLHQMFRYGVYGQWDAFRDYLLEDATVHHDTSGSGMKATAAPSTTETVSSARGVDSSASVSLATPSPSEDSSEEEEGDDVTSRVDAGDIDEFGMVISDDAVDGGDDREEGDIKGNREGEGEGGGGSRSKIDEEISPIRLKALMIMWTGVLYRTIMTCAHGMVARKRASMKASKEEEEASQDGSPATSQEESRGRTPPSPSPSPSVDDDTPEGKVEEEKGGEGPRQGHHTHHHHSQYQLFASEDTAGVYAHVKWIYDVDLLKVMLKEVESDPELKSAVMGERESDVAMTVDEPADVRKAIVTELDEERTALDTAKMDKLFMWTAMPDVIGHVAETSVTAMWKYNRNGDLQDLVLAAKNAEREINQADALYGLYNEATAELFNDDDYYYGAEDEECGEGEDTGEEWRLGQRARVVMGEEEEEDYELCRLKRRIMSEGEDTVQWRVEWIGSDRAPENVAQDRLRHLPPSSGEPSMPTWIVRAMPRKTTQSSGCRLWWCPRDDKELLRILRVKKGLHTVTTTMTDADSDNTYFLERVEELRLEQERQIAASGRPKKSKSSKEDGKGDSNAIEIPNVLFCLGRVRSLWQEWKNQQRALLWTADTDTAKDMVKAFVDTVLSIGVPPAVLDPVLRKTGLRTTFAKIPVNGKDASGVGDGKGEKDVKVEGEDDEQRHELELEAIIKWLGSGNMAKSDITMMDNATASSAGGLLPPISRIGAGEPGAMEMIKSEIDSEFDGLGIFNKHLSRLRPPSTDHWLLLVRSKCVVTELQDKVKLADLRRVLTVYLDELKSQLSSKGEAVAAPSGSECYVIFFLMMLPDGKETSEQPSTHHLQHPSEYITRDMFVNAGFAFVSEDQKIAYQASVNHMRLLQSHNLLRTQLLCTTDRMQQYNMYASLTGGLGELVPVEDGNYTKAIVERINTLYGLAGLERPSLRALGLMIRTLKFGMNTSSERREVSAILEKLADGLANKQTYERNQEAKQKRLMAEPSVEAKWCHPARVEAAKRFIRWKGVTPWTLDQVLGILGISGDKRRRLLGEPYSFEDKGPALREPDDEENNDESEREMISKALKEPLTEPEVEWDMNVAWEMMRKAANDVGKDNDDSVLASFVPPTANKLWANSFLDDVKAEEPKIQKSKRLGSAHALKDLPQLKPQDLLDFGYMYLTHLAYEEMISEGADRETTELPNGLIQNQYGKELKSVVMMHMTFDDLPEDLNLKCPLALVTVNGDKPQDEIIRLQMLLTLRQYICFGSSPGRGTSGRSKKAAQQSPESPRDAFESRVRRLVDLAAELPRMRGAASGKILWWWKPEIHDSAILVLFIIYGLPDTWRAKDILLQEDLPFYQYCKSALCVGHSQRRRRCNDGRSDDPNSLAFKVKMHITDEVMPALMSRLKDITRLHLFRMYPAPAPPAVRTGKGASGGSGSAKAKSRGKGKKHGHASGAPSSAASPAGGDEAPAVVPFVADSPKSERSTSKGPARKKRRAASAAKGHQAGATTPSHGKRTPGTTPKKPSFTAWSMFQKVEWAKIKEDFPNMPWDEGSREVARKWKLVDPEEKRQWKDEADRERLKWEASPEGMALMRGETPKKATSSAAKRKRSTQKSEGSTASARSTRRRSTATSRMSPQAEEQQPADDSADVPSTEDIPMEMVEEELD
ncbi:hypothetical protein FOL47_002434 [Perkinsus chesapeaki]|uniref:Choline dehydrogenase 7 n=1 Tax=Perkinsus chesapeaki TaxID=330153 RepID=A0A7J6MDC3_PERCH|nr:hypothetical protein FOL47_002434 [Perkinsus chesapeaki]